MKFSNKAFNIFAASVIILFFVISCSKDEEGQEESLTVNELPSCQILTPVDSTRFQKGVEIVISAEASDSDGEVEEVKFFINDEIVTSIYQFPYIYKWNTTNQDVGLYTVKIQAEDDKGGVSDYSSIVCIISNDNILPPIAAFIVDDNTIGIGDTLHFTDQSENYPNSWAWDFGDGTYSNEQSPSKVYSELGDYSVSFSVGNEVGIDQITKENFISVVMKPEAEFSVDDTLVEPGVVVQFNDESINEPTSWVWSFGDGSSSYEQNPQKIYYEVGEFSVSLSVSNDNGTDDIVKNNLINVAEKPIANFSSDNMLAEIDDEVQFTDLSENNPVSWYWDFGDGTSSTEQNPVQIYETDGEYTVTLKVFNEFGWVDSLVKERYISVGPLEFVDPRDGQVYGIVNIGEQIWMTRNLNYSFDNAVYYEDDEGYSNFGLLYPDYYYNNTDLVPDGWHIPSFEEWLELIEFVGGISVAGGKLKENDLEYWLDNTGATDEYGFSARGGGYFTFDEFDDIKYKATFLTSTVSWDPDGENPASVCIKFFSNNENVSTTYFTEYFGAKLSIRLIKD